jgi:hypothetical protein
MAFMGGWVPRRGGACSRACSLEQLAHELATLALRKLLLAGWRQLIATPRARTQQFHQLKCSRIPGCRYAQIIPRRVHLGHMHRCSDSSHAPYREWTTTLTTWMGAQQVSKLKQTQ